MAQKLVTTVRLEPPQLAYLEAEAKRLGISIGETLRRIIDAYREGRDQ